MATLSYNGWTWAASCRYKTSVSTRPIQDDARRTTVAVEHTITVVGFITGGADTSLTSIRKLLTAQAGEIKYNDLGFGTLHVNGNSNVRDAHWGPATKMVDYKPLGGDGQAAMVTWQAVVVIPECEDRTTYQRGIMALNYEVRFDIDGDGYTTEHVSGYIEIPMTRWAAGSRVVPDSVDRFGAYREKLEAREVRQGFRRGPQSFTVSPDRRRLDFSWADTQMPSPLPNRVTKIDLRQGVKSRTKLIQAVMWNVTFSGTITMAAGVPKNEALGIFLSLVASRIAKPKQAMWVNLEIEDDVFGRSSRFSLTIQHLAAAPLPEILDAYRMWTPVKGASWAGWRESMYATKVFRSRGQAGLSYEAAEDAIVDLCEVFAPPVAPDDPDDDGKPPGHTISTTVIRSTKRDPASSWIDFRMGFIWRERSNVVAHKPLPKDPVEPPGAGRGGSLRPFDTGGPAGGSLQAFPAGRGGSLRPFPESKGQAVAPMAVGADKPLDATAGPSANQGRSPAFAPDLTQGAAGASRRMVLWGNALRIGYKITPARLDNVGGVAVVEEWREVNAFVAGRIDGDAVHACEWAIGYIVPDSPEGPLSIPGNPWLDVPGDAEK